MRCDGRDGEVHSNQRLDRSATCQIRNFEAGLSASMDALEQNLGFTRFMSAR